MSLKINACINCGDKHAVVEWFCDICYVLCKGCKETSCDCKNEKQALADWNKKT